MSDETEAAPVEATEEQKTTKSIVPSKYSGRYKNGGEGPLAEFIKTQSTVDSVFSFDRFFALCLKNGLPQDKVDHYRGQVQEKRHGAEGRTRMTLRNMLATIARKNGKLIGLDDAEVQIDLPKAALTGAAAKAAANKQAAA